MSEQLGCKIANDYGQTIAAYVGAEIAVEWNGTVHMPEGYEPSPAEKAIIGAFQHIIRPKFTLEQAVAVLNERKHNECNYWVIEKYKDYSLVAGNREYDEFVAFAIAEKYLREAE